MTETQPGGPPGHTVHEPGGGSADAVTGADHIAVVGADHRLHLGTRRATDDISWVASCGAGPCRRPRWADLSHLELCDGCERRILASADTSRPPETAAGVLGGRPAEPGGPPAAVLAHVTATGIILAESNVLLVDHHKLKGWMCPGGHVEDGEYPEETLRREILEEVGLDVEFVDDDAPAGPASVTKPWRVHLYNVDDHPSGGPLTHVDCVYVCTPASGRRAIAGEYGNRARWVPVDEVSSLNTYRELPGLVQQAAAFARRCGLNTGGPAPTPPERPAGDAGPLAWELLVELGSGAAAQPPGHTDDVTREALSSLSQLVDRTRALLATHGRPAAVTSAATVESSAWALLNQELRPFLTRWQPRLARFERQLGAPDETHWEHRPVFLTELAQLRCRLAEIAVMFGHLAGVPCPETLIPTGAGIHNKGQDRPRLGCHPPPATGVALRAATPRTVDLARKVRQLLDEHADHVPFHGWAHTDFVRTKAGEFADARQADTEVVEAAALVHDLNYLAAPNSAPGAGHDLRSRLLAACGFTRGEIDRIETIIARAHTHDRQPHVDRETACLSDADTLYKALPITPVLFAHLYLEENDIALGDLARKIVDEQASKLAAGYYFYDQALSDRYQGWAVANLGLWEAILDALADPDVGHLIEHAVPRPAGGRTHSSLETPSSKLREEPNG